MKKLQVLLEGDTFKDIYVPVEFTDDEVTPHLDQLFGEDFWCTYREYK